RRPPQAHALALTRALPWALRRYRRGRELARGGGVLDLPRPPAVALRRPPRPGRAAGRDRRDAARLHRSRRADQPAALDAAAPRRAGLASAPADPGRKRCRLRPRRGGGLLRRRWTAGTLRRRPDHDAGDARLVASRAVAADRAARTARRRAQPEAAGRAWKRRRRPRLDRAAASAQTRRRGGSER